MKVIQNAETSKVNEKAESDLRKLSEFIAIESNGHYSRSCSTCRKDDRLMAIQVSVSGFVAFGLGGFILSRFAVAALENQSVSSILGVASGFLVLLFGLWFFMPKIGGIHHQYILGWSKLPIIGPRLKRQVELERKAFEDRISSNSV